MSTRKYHRHAMTAIEVLAATVLASLMLGSVMGVLGGLTRQQRALRMPSSAPSWHRQLADQLLWDLQNSREVVASRDGVRLVGFAGRDFASGRPTGRLTAVEYYLLDADGNRYLVRREEQLDARTTDNWRIEVVCRGVQHFDFGATTVDQATAVHLSANPQDAAIPVPERVAVKIYNVENGLPLFDQQFILR